MAEVDPLDHQKMKIKEEKTLKLASVSTLGPFQTHEQVCAKRMRIGSAAPRPWRDLIVTSRVCVTMTFRSALTHCTLSTGSCRHNSNQEDRRLPPPAHEPGQTAANDGGDDGQRQGAGPDRAHLLAVHKRRTGAEAQVILPLFGCSSFRLSPGHPCRMCAQ